MTLMLLLVRVLTALIALVGDAPVSLGLSAGSRLCCCGGGGGGGCRHSRAGVGAVALGPRTVGLRHHQGQTGLGADGADSLVGGDQAGSCYLVEPVTAPVS